LRQHTWTPRIEDRKLLDTYHSKPCAACGRAGGSDPAHIRSRGAGGDDVENNLIALCRPCHTKSHALGWKGFCDLFPRMESVLSGLGWAFDLNNKLRRK